jgi:ABC-type cobalamin/Fe3+-siderophores transport system ATPase subunit
MPFQLNIPAISGTALQFTLEVGQILFVLGANGTGKSSLMQRLNKGHRTDARWISAHRQSWFGSDSINLSPQQKRETEKNMHNADLQSQSRWKDDYAGQRANIAIYELVETENADARSIAKAARAADSALVKTLVQKTPPSKSSMSC